jgi:TolB-like protein/DNA-binding winged helix-turn-helix (wHTH) protein
LNSRLKPLYEFGSFKIDAARRLLLRDGAPVVLTAKAFDLLLLLVERGGEVVSKDELMQILWPSTVVIEANLTQQVAMVRKALGEAGHRYVMTHPGRGYSLAEPVHVISVPDAHDRAEPEPAPLLQDRRGRLDDEAVAATAEQRTPAGGVHSERWLPRWARVALPPILGVIAVLVWVWLRHPPSPPPSASRGPSHPSMLAVLPFQNLSNDPEQEYVSDGLTEETIADLGELSPQRLGVIARTSAMTYKHSSKSVTQIGNELGADYLLEGSVRREGALVRVTAQLIRVKDQSHLWAHSYDRGLIGLLALQKEMGRAIAQQVRVQLATAYTDSAAGNYVPNSEAYELYLQGLAHIAKRTSEEILRGIDCFERASAKDSSFALAYAELASAHIAYAVFDPEKSYPAAAAAATRALDLDDGLAEAHAALGAEKAGFEYDWPGARIELERATELNPNSAEAHFRLSLSYLTPLGNSSDAIVQMRKALELDPLSPIYNTVTGLTYYLEARLREPQFFSHVHQGGSGLRLVTLRPALREFDKVNGLVTYKMTEQFDEFPDAQLRPVS